METKVSFEIVIFMLDQGVLVVNGVDWGSYPEAPGMYTGLPLTTADGRTFWDWFTGFSDYPEGYEPVAYGNLSGAELGKYSTLVWMAAFNEDFASNQSLIKSFISAGGKFMIHGHNLPSYLDEDFVTNYAHITWGTGDVVVNADNIIVALESGLVDMGPGNGSSSASLSDLMVLDDSGLSEGIFAYGSADGELIGVKSRLTPDGPYQVVLIGARPFRLDLDGMRTNYQYILETIFEE
jgi:hypothetical protein